MKLLAKITKQWSACIDCPMNYDGLDCRLYVEGYREDVGVKFDPYESTPEWCNVRAICFYDYCEDDGLNDQTPRNKTD